TSTSSRPTRLAFSPLRSSARYDTSSLGSLASAPRSLSEASLSEPTWPLKPSVPATTASSLKVVPSVTSSAVPPSESEPPGPTHSVTSVSVTESACASVSVVLPSSPLTLPSCISNPATFSTTSPSSTFSAAAPVIDRSTPAFSASLKSGSAIPADTSKADQSSLSGSLVASVSPPYTLFISTPMSQALNTSTSSRPTRLAFSPLRSSARYDTSSLGSLASAPRSLSEASLSEPT